jgi:hypothetical protein
MPFGYLELIVLRDNRVKAQEETRNLLIAADDANFVWNSVAPKLDSVPENCVQFHFDLNFGSFGCQLRTQIWFSNLQYPRLGSILRVSISS